MIETAKDFEDALAQQSRYYRAVHEIWKSTSVSDTEKLAKAVALVGKLLDKLSEVQSEIERYSGAADMRVIIAELAEIRNSKSSATMQGE